MMVMMAAFAIATPHALVLTVSHGLLFANPLVCNGIAAAISLTFVTSNWARLSGPPLTMRGTRRTAGIWPPLMSRTQATAALDCGVANL